MSNTSRIVHRLRLRAAGESAIHRATLLLEDALRTASMPDAAGRIVLVRRLALGRIDNRSSPQTLALALERAVALLTPECVHAGSANAQHAPAVWFRDALDAHIQLALRLAAGDVADAWYWVLAIGAWRPRAPVSQALRQIVFSLAALPEAPTALPRWTATMVEAGHAERLIAALRAEDVPRLSQAAGLRVPTPARPSRSPRSLPRLHAPSKAPSTAVTVAPDTPRPRLRTGSTDPRRELLRALLRAAGAWIVSPTAQPAAALVSADASSSRSTVEPADGYDARPTRIPDRSVSNTARVATATGTRASTSRTSKVKPRDHSGDLADPACAMRGPADVSPSSRPAFSWALPDATTRAGGLLFLLPVLQRLGYHGWLEDQPEWTRFDIAQRVLAVVLARVQVAQEDAAWRLAGHRPVARSAPRRFVAPAQWREDLAIGNRNVRNTEYGDVRTLWDASGRLLLGVWSGHCPRSLMRAWRLAEPRAGSGFHPDRTELVTMAWVVAARRWLRRHAGIGLADLVLRPAALTVSPTHADVCFEMGLVELRIRRAGLDIDPGWVPWFGRVVTFRYDR